MRKERGAWKAWKTVRGGVGSRVGTHGELNATGVEMVLTVTARAW